MSVDIREAVETLVKLKTEYLGQKKGHQDAVKTLDKKLKKVGSAIRVLGEEEETKPSEAVAPKPTKSPSKAEVMQVVTAFLEDNAPQGYPIEDVKGWTQDKLREQGFKLTGVFKNFNSYLSEADNISEISPGHFAINPQVIKVA